MAPAIPSSIPNDARREAAPTAAPASAPLITRAANAAACFRLGVIGSLSATISDSASPTRRRFSFRPSRKASRVPPVGTDPARTARLTAAAGSMLRAPPATPNKNAHVNGTRIRSLTPYDDARAAACCRSARSSPARGLNLNIFSLIAAPLQSMPLPETIHNTARNEATAISHLFRRLKY